MRRHPLIAVATVAGLALAACADGGGSSGGDDGAAIVVTTPILGDVVENLTGGLADVEVVVRPATTHLAALVGHWPDVLTTLRDLTGTPTGRQSG